MDMRGAHACRIWPTVAWSALPLPPEPRRSFRQRPALTASDSPHACATRNPVACCPCGVVRSASRVRRAVAAAAAMLPVFSRSNVSSAYEVLLLQRRSGEWHLPSSLHRRAPPPPPLSPTVYATAISVTAIAAVAIVLAIATSSPLPRHLLLALASSLHPFARAGANLLSRSCAPTRSTRARARARSFMRSCSLALCS